MARFWFPALPSPRVPPPPSDPNGPVFLNVPFPEKDDAKALGARWDPSARMWFVPRGQESRRFARWLLEDLGHRPERLPEQQTVRAGVVALPGHCYRCGAAIRSVVGVLVAPDLALDPGGFIDLEYCADAIAHAFNGSPDRSRLRIGILRHRTSRARPEGYVANGCIECDAIQGNFPLQEDLTEYFAVGGEYEPLVVAEVALPLDAIPLWDDE